MRYRIVYFTTFAAILLTTACGMPIIKKDTHTFATTGLFMDCRLEQTACNTVDITKMKQMFQTIKKEDSFEDVRRKGFSICKDDGCATWHQNTTMLIGSKALEAIGIDIGKPALSNTAETKHFTQMLEEYQAWIFTEKNIKSVDDRIYINTYNKREDGYDITFAILFFKGKVEKATMTGGDVNKTFSEKGLLIGPGDMISNAAKGAAGAFVP
ncbi:MAG: hypothetical protein COW88_01250 [Candidatus Lloydbacteria bacterium CG22_combo_CG10-13_8_21_14_all_47_15]|uniref:Lipoprotein n=1 Tax=Candidatus Lloydbacteria bacterium CG22_combo_CG10-13_8_21_14_all_47_15 TaxID=1974635 RepID=A0A2H0CV48_9BACT|nr:MAG: hypothetical protein COW88_01250 [Candidatus Lloydbacteria bacterium CG22_combo_CG10-13_8_21_14_all_47_15]